MLQMNRLFRKLHSRLESKQHKADIAMDVVASCFTDAQRAAIKDGNSALSKYLGRDLARFGYPVRDVPEGTSSAEAGNGNVARKTPQATLFAILETFSRKHSQLRTRGAM